VGFFLLVGGLHAVIYYLNDLSFQKTSFVESYAGNLLLTLLLLMGLLKAFEHYSHYVAWLYLVGSALKFGGFFLILWPIFHQDGSFSFLEKLTFLIPYLTGLFLETGILISKLNKI
jgi:hypothetical protein